MNTNLNTNILMIDDFKRKRLTKFKKWKFSTYFYHIITVMVGNQAL